MGNLLNSFSSTQVAELNENLQADGFVKVAPFFSPIFSDHLVREISEKPHLFVPREYEGIGNELFFANMKVYKQIESILNSEDMLSFIQKITGLNQINRSNGRICKIEPSDDTALNWHDDSGSPNRVAGMRINLSSQFFEGGDFSLRTINKPESAKTAPRLNLNEALVFQVKPGNLEHMVTSVTGDNPRISCIAWFYID